MYGNAPSTNPNQPTRFLLFFLSHQPHPPPSHEHTGNIDDHLQLCDEFDFIGTSMRTYNGPAHINFPTNSPPPLHFPTGQCVYIFNENTRNSQLQQHAGGESDEDIQVGNLPVRPLVQWWPYIEGYNVSPGII